MTQNCELTGMTDEQLTHHFEKQRNQDHFKQHGEPETCKRCAEAARERWGR